MLRLSIFFSLTLYCTSICFGQPQKKMSYTQLIDEIFSNDKKELIYLNIHFVNDLPEKGLEYFTTSHNIPPSPVGIYGGIKKYLEQKGIKKDSDGYYLSEHNSIAFEDCKFDNDLRFSNVRFKGTVSFVNNDFPTISEDFVGLYGQNFGGAILIDSCKFDANLEVLFRKETPYRFFFKFNHSEANSFQLELQKSSAEIRKTKINDNTFVQIHGESNLEIDSLKYTSSYFELDKINLFKLTNSICNDSTDEFNKLDLQSDIITLVNNVFNANTHVILENSSVQLLNNSFNKKLALGLNEIKNTSILSLSSLKKLDFGISDGDYYNASTPDQIKDEYSYKKFIFTYKLLYDHFKEVGDIASANETYVKIREIENQKLKFLRKTNPSFKNYFDYNLNRLLKFYTNYGTDPARALIVSIYIILGFAVFYFFFPSDWDLTSKNLIKQKLSDFLQKKDKGYLKHFLSLGLIILISTVNSITLSLNAFTTLGFGNIPTKGVARYVCIIQGFLGWFLLSVFTVALFNQVQF